VSRLLLPAPLPPVESSRRGAARARAESRRVLRAGRRFPPRPRPRGCAGGPPCRGLCSSIHPKRERFGSKQILSKGLRKPGKSATDVPLRVLRWYHRGRVFQDQCTIWSLVPQPWKRHFRRLWHSARFTCSWAFRLPLRQIPSGKGCHFGAPLALCQIHDVNSTFRRAAARRLRRLRSTGHREGDRDRAAQFPSWEAGRVTFGLSGTLPDFRIRGMPGKARSVA
jgi:hypothetical protein